MITSFETTRPLSSIHVTQASLRNVCQLVPMIDFIKCGGHWTREALDEFALSNGSKTGCPLIQLSSFEDGRVFAHDGHHRLVSTYAGGRYYLLPDEYQITHWTYALYMEVNLKVGWCTPFDPRKEIRLGDLNEFKNQVRELQAHDAMKAVEFVQGNRQRYCTKREFATVSDLWGLTRSLKEWGSCYPVGGKGKNF